MIPVAPSNLSPHSPSPTTPHTYIGDGEMSTYNDQRTCSLCGVRIHNFRVIKPIIRWDESRPYYHRTGRNRGLSPRRQISWSCGKHHVIDPDWLGHFGKLGVDNGYSHPHNHGMAIEARQELRDIRDKMGLSREKFAQQLGVSSASIFRYEDGSRPVKDTVLFLARRLVMERNQTAA